MSRRKAIKDECISCTAGSKKAVRDCIIENCELYTYRLGKMEKGKSIERNRAIKDYCKHCQGGDRKLVKECHINGCSLYSYR
jgi:hypothetical protein